MEHEATGFLHEPTNWVFISFVIFVVLFIRFGWEKVTAKLDGRIARIREDLATAERLRKEAQDMLAQYQQKHRDAMHEAQEIAARARAQVETIRKKAEDDLRETLARREKQLEERLNRIAQAAEDELRKATAELALRASEALIRKSLDAKGQAALVDKSLANLPANLN
jgi:F-type H+-transporting ATPase subunit b